MQHFQQELAAFQEKLVTMAGRAEAAANQSMLALRDRDRDIAEQVIADDFLLDRAEMEIDTLAIELLAKAPLAGDLRLIAVGMKISHDLERVGDESVKIARRVRELCDEPALKDMVNMAELAKLALETLKKSLDAFIAKDAEAARQLTLHDKEVDALNHEIQQRLTTIITENSAMVHRSLKLMVIAKSLERIADHAVSIAEEVVFLTEARDIRHPKHFAAPPVG
jgi:phosphate transport system protein